MAEGTICFFVLPVRKLSPGVLKLMFLFKQTCWVAISSWAGCTDKPCFSGLISLGHSQSTKAFGLFTSFIFKASHRPMVRGILAQVCPEDFVPLVFMVVGGGKCTTKHGKAWSFQAQRVNVQHALLQLFKCRYFTAGPLIQPNSPVTEIEVLHLLTIVLLFCTVNILSLSRGYRGKEGEKRVNRIHESTFDVSKTMPFVLISAGWSKWNGNKPIYLNLATATGEIFPSIWLKWIKTSE